MQRLTDQIMADVEGLPEGTGVSAKALLHFGNRAAVDQALSSLARRNCLVVNGGAKPGQRGGVKAGHLRRALTI
ncbi:hypothetical protein EDF69_001486 [Sphingomonas sp. JUb134]|nr:hypothetical protein [Sphingomonas sp. JUb134]